MSRPRPRLARTARARSTFGTLGLVVTMSLVTVGAPASAASSNGKAPEKIVKAGLLAPRDIDDSWTVEEIEAGTSFGPKDVAECRRVTRATHRGRVAYGISKRFSRGTANVSSSMSVYRSKARAKAALRAIGGEDAQTCLSTVVQRELREGGTRAGQTSVAVAIATSEPPSLGDDAVAFTVDAEGATRAGTSRVTAMLVVIREGRANLAATFQDARSAPDLDTVTNVLREPVDRLAKAQR